MNTSLLAADRVVLLLSLVPYLREHGPTSVSELSGAFDVDAKTLRSLITFLGTAGIPGETMTSQHEDMFDIDWTAFEEHDVVSLTNIVAVDDTPRFASTETAALIAGLQALTAMLPEGEAHVARRTAEKLGVALGIDESNAAVSVTTDPQDARLPELFAAMRDRKRVSFTYRDVAGTETTRTVDPLRLTEGTGVWYLRAFCLERGAERLFRVDRITSLQTLDVDAEPRGPLGDGDEGADAAHTSVTVTARVRESALNQLSGFQLTVLGEASAGWVRIALELGSVHAAAAAVQSARGELIVEDPPAARTAVYEWAERALAQYDS